MILNIKISFFKVYLILFLLTIAGKWNQIFKALSDDVKFLDFKNEQVLFLEVSNSSILYSISINKSKIIKSIEELTGIKVIDIKVLVK